MQKDFDSWNRFKKSINSKPRGSYFKEREVWYTAVGLNVGYEEDGKNNQYERPVLVLKKFNQHFFIGTPFSTIVKPNNRHYLTINMTKDKQSSVILSQTKPFSSKRLLRRMNILNDSQFEKVKIAVSNEFFGENKTDSTKVKSSGPESIYKPSLSNINNFVNTTSIGLKKSDPAKQSPRSPKAISSPTIAVSATIVNKAKKGLADG